MKSVKEKRAKYPDGWELFSMRLINERAKGKCERCGAERKKPENKFGKRVTLGVAHLDHDETHMDETRCMVMCGKCHLDYDRRDNIKRKRALKFKRNPNQLTLFIFTVTLIYLL